MGIRVPSGWMVNEDEKGIQDGAWTNQKAQEEEIATVHSSPRGSRSISHSSTSSSRSSSSSSSSSRSSSSISSISSSSRGIRE